MARVDVWRQIPIKIQGEVKVVQARYVRDYDPAGKLKIMKYGHKRYALFRVEDSQVILQDCMGIKPVSNGMSFYTDLEGYWGILNERGQVTCRAGVLKSSRIKKYGKNSDVKK